MYQHRVNLIILIMIFIGLFLVASIIIGIMGKSKKMWITSLILLIIYILTVNPFYIYQWISALNN